MDLQQFQQLLIQKQQEIEQALRRTLPIKVGRIAKDHFQDNFRHPSCLYILIYVCPKIFRKVSCPCLRRLT